MKAQDNIKTQVSAALVEDFFYVFDTDQRFTYVNPSLLSLWKKNLPEVIGKNFEDLGYPAHLVALHRKQLDEALTGHIVYGENEFTDSDNVTSVYEYTFVPVMDSESKVIAVAGSTRNITSRKFVAEKLLHSEEQRLQREKLVAGLSHDLRSPLTAAKLKAHILQRKISDPKLNDLAKKIGNDMDRADKMISDILDASRIEAGEPMHLNFKALNFTNIVENVIEEYRIIHGQRFKFARVENPEGHWDEEAIKRILENLLNNAVKYGDDKSPITVGLMFKDSKVSLSIGNKGEMIPEAELSKLFEVFKRSNLAVGKPGWGLGLTLVKGLTEAHGGNVNVKSCNSEGTVFTVTLPMDSRKA